MPGRSKVHKFSAAKEGEFRMRALDVLSNSENAMTIEEIQKEDMILRGLSSQKLSRVLGYLVEMGFVRKAKSKTLGRMVYKSISVMAEQGYEITPTEKPYDGTDWELEEEINRMFSNDEEEYYE